MEVINRIEDIWPLTIINPRFNKNFVILNSDSKSFFVESIEDDEEIAFCLDVWLEDHVSSCCCYGVGETIDKAFKDFQKRYDYSNFTE